MIYIDPFLNLTLSILNRVTHFELLADDPERVQKFYKKVFDWKFEKWDSPMEYWMVRTGEGEGIDGGLSIRTPESPTMNTIEVADLDKTLAKVKENGGTVVTSSNPIPGVGWFAVFMDTDQNIFGLMQIDSEAK